MRISDWSSDVCSSDLSFKTRSASMDRWITGHFHLSRLLFLRDCNYCAGRHYAYCISLAADGGAVFCCSAGCRHEGQTCDGGVDRKSVVEGKSVSVRVGSGCRRINKKKKAESHT